MEKISGSAGSGVTGNNTKKIDMPLSDYISTGTRKGLLDNMEYTEKEIDFKDIKYVAQPKYVPKKLNKMIENYEEIKKLPFDVLEVDGEYHVIDGHHRFLAHKKKGAKKVSVKVYKSRIKKGFVLKLANNLNVNSVSSIAKSKSISQGEYADKMGVSVKTLRKFMADNDITWKNVNGYRVKRKPIKNTNSTSIKKNNHYKNPSNPNYKPDYGSGNLKIR